MESIKKFIIEYDVNALSDLRIISDYIQDADCLEHAVYVTEQLMQAAESVAVFPHKHRKEPIFKDENIRFTVKWSYKIIFRINNNKVIILTIFHTSQNPQKIVR